MLLASFSFVLLTPKCKLNKYFSEYSTFQTEDFNRSICRFLFKLVNQSHSSTTCCNVVFYHNFMANEIAFMLTILLDINFHKILPMSSKLTCK